MPLMVPLMLLLLLLLPLLLLATSPPRAALASFAPAPASCTRLFALAGASTSPSACAALATAVATRWSETGPCGSGSGSNNGGVVVTGDVGNASASVVNTLASCFATATLAPQTLPFWGVAGETDSLAALQAAARADPTRRWTFPASYYAVNVTSSPTLRVLLVVVDALALANPSADNAQQLAWIRATLSSPAARTADWLLVAGHYPIQSATSFNPALAQTLDPILRDNFVDVYVSGHDWNLQHLATGVGNSLVNYVVSGSSGAPNVNANGNAAAPGLLSFQPVFGFASLILNANGQGTLRLHSVSTVPRASESIAYSAPLTSKAPIRRVTAAGPPTFPPTGVVASAEDPPRATFIVVFTSVVVIIAVVLGINVCCRRGSQLKGYDDAIGASGGLSHDAGGGRGGGASATTQPSQPFAYAAQRMESRIQAV